MWDLIVSVPDHCLSFYFRKSRTSAMYLNELENRKLSHKEKLLEYAADIEISH